MNANGINEDPCKNLQERYNFSLNIPLLFLAPSGIFRFYVHTITDEDDNITTISVLFQIDNQ